MNQLGTEGKNRVNDNSRHLWSLKTWFIALQLNSLAAESFSRRQREDDGCLFDEDDKKCLSNNQFPFSAENRCFVDSAEIFLGIVNSGCDGWFIRITPKEYIRKRDSIRSALINADISSFAFSPVAGISFYGWIQIWGVFHLNFVRFSIPHMCIREFIVLPNDFMSEYLSSFWMPRLNPSADVTLFWSAVYRRLWKVFPENQKSLGVRKSRLWDRIMKSISQRSFFALAKPRTEMTEKTW